MIDPLMYVTYKYCNIRRNCQSILVSERKFNLKMVNSLWVYVLLTLLYLQGNEGASLSTQNRLVGGVTGLGFSTDRYSMASVRFSNVQGQFHLCGGFIINKRWVGTAAQCLEGQTTQNTVVAVGTTSIVLGTVYGLSQIEMHQNFNVITIPKNRYSPEQGD